MKKTSLLFVLYLLQFSVYAQNDSIFIMRHGIIIYQKALNEIDSILYYRDDFNLNGTFYDSRDSTIYPTIIIGNQIWFAANLRYLPSVSPPSIASDQTPLYYVYNYIGNNKYEAKNTTYYQTYGVLYNHRAALTACPTGWHLPTVSEYQILIDYLGGASLAGGKMKLSGLSFWESPNYGGTNESGFSGQGGGFLLSNPPQFRNIKSVGYFWSQPDNYQYGVGNTILLVSNSRSVVSNIFLTSWGFSVRCIRDPF